VSEPQKLDSDVFLQIRQLFPFVNLWEIAATQYTCSSYSTDSSSSFWCSFSQC